MRIQNFPVVVSVFFSDKYGHHYTFISCILSRCLSIQYTLVWNDVLQHSTLCKLRETRALSQNVTNAPEGSLSPNLKNVQVTVKNNPGQKFKYENQQRALNPTVWCLEIWFLCTAPLLNDSYLPMKFQVTCLITFWVMLRTKFKNEILQRAIIPKVWSFELWFLCTALLLNEIYLPSLCSFMLMPCVVLKLGSGQKSRMKMNKGQ